MMQWIKHGVIWRPDGTQPWARTHGMGPTPFQLDDDVIRLYVTCLDDQGRGRPTFIDVSAHDPRQVLREAGRPLLDIGQNGSFDDNGLMATAVVRASPGRIHMYYAGFEILHNIRYRILTGLAVSLDGGETFTRHSTTPMLERSPAELHFRCGPYVMKDGDTFRLWYIAGSSWEDVNGKPSPIYDLRYLESPDGIHWAAEGRESMRLSDGDEHGFGRPWVLKCPSTGLHRMFYSIRKRSLAAYRLGYAESFDGLTWTRRADEMGLDVGDSGPDTEAIMYSTVLQAHGKTYCFYNGNGFGADGICLAELAAP